MPREDGTGEGSPSNSVGTAHPEVGASFGGCVARPRKGGGVCDGGSAHTAFGLVKETLGESIERSGG